MGLIGDRDINRDLEVLPNVVLPQRRDTCNLVHVEAEIIRRVGGEEERVGEEDEGEELEKNVQHLRKVHLDEKNPHYHFFGVPPLELGGGRDKRSVSARTDWTGGV